MRLRQYVRYMSFLPVFLIAGCASTSNRVMPGYGRMDAANSPLGVILMKRNLQVLNADDVARDLGKGGPEGAFYDFFGAEFPAAMKESSRFRAVYFARDADEMMLRDGAAPLDNGNIRASLPSRKRFFSDSLHYLLIVDFLSVNHERKTNTPVKASEMADAMAAVLARMCELDVKANPPKPLGNEKEWETK
jgi:hypothetical protein